MPISNTTKKDIRVDVTKTFLPSLESYTTILKRAWDNVWLTNRGELVLELEDQIKEHLGVDNVIVMNNGTIPMQIALKLLGNSGEVITTPFSYVATSASVVWENCSPIFVDIEEDTWTIDPKKIEAAITNKTTCILATHIFGNPCDIDKIAIIAKKHNLKIIYDAAHSFGVKYNGKSIFTYGDVSTCSFHATKIFHTGEGGAAFCNDHELRSKIFYSHNFGHNGHLDFHGLGINGKISELQAAMGLSVLPHMNDIYKERKRAIDFYNANINFTNIGKIKIRDNTEWNYSYMPILMADEKTLTAVLIALNEMNIFPRRYFYPSLNTLPYLKYDPMPISESVSKRILCLPVYHQITDNQLMTIVNLINSKV
jgi:dTDP-4-amino-4,6-dideoxygalactose transaminase